MSKISVLIPTYNYAQFLPEAIESVLAQDFRDFELLIVDDCSPDNTAEIVQPYGAKDPRIRFSINPTNLGMVNNWNHCLELARGEYIKFLFGDDKLCDRGALGKLLALLETHPTATLAASARLILNERSEAMEVCRTFANGYHEGRDVIMACLEEYGNLVGEPSAVLFRKRDAGVGFNPQYRQIVDADLWFRLLEKGGLAYTGETLCGFRRHDRQQTVVNFANRVVEKEGALFFTGYAEKYLSRKVAFTVLYHLRRSRRKNGKDADPELLEVEEDLTRRLGEGWYFVHYILYKIRRPFENLSRSARKRWRRRHS